MGRPYREDLRLLDATYAFARAVPLAPLTDAVHALREHPMLVVGSGGSLSACHLAARLHESQARLPARVLTPLEFVRHPVPQTAGVLLLSAGGGNPDVLAAASHAIAAEYAPVVGVCTRAGMPLAAALAASRHARVIEYVGPSGKDGFLATNSLLLTATVLARAYGVDLPPALAPLAHGPALGASPGRSAGDPEYLSGASETVAALLRPHVLVLAGGWAAPAAFDLESKWAESGFGSVTVTDPRNFAHGRHQGLARRLETSVVVGLVTPDDDGLVARTLARLPNALPRLLLATPSDGAAGALDLLARVIRLTGEVGVIAGIDPGRPRVPAFGRALYQDGIPRRLLRSAGTSDARSDVLAQDLEAVADEARDGGRSGGTIAQDATATPEAGGSGVALRRAQSHHDLWIRRKVSPAVWQGAPRAVRARWRAACATWVRTVETARIGGVVLDYDGTLCEADERFGTPAAAVGEALARLATQGAVVGIATGRGNSVLSALRAVVPEAVWSTVTVGMYNGGLLCRLHESPGGAQDPAPEVLDAERLLQDSPVLREVAHVRRRPTQLTVRALRPLPDGLLHRLVVETLAPAGPRVPVQVFSSGHTVDVLAAGVSKLRVVDEVRTRLRGRAAVLTIGDQGRATGNDSALLAHPLGLSVEHASSALDACWNVAPPGVRRTTALLGYLDALQPRAAGGFRWSATRASRPPRPDSGAAGAQGTRGTRTDGLPTCESRDAGSDATIGPTTGPASSTTAAVIAAALTSTPAAVPSVA